MTAKPMTLIGLYRPQLWSHIKFYYDLFLILGQVKELKKHYAQTRYLERSFGGYPARITNFG